MRVPFCGSSSSMTSRAAIYGKMVREYATGRNLNVDIYALR